MMNLLKNGGFEADWADEKSHAVRIFPGGKLETRGNIFSPPDWTPWFVTKADSVEYGQPEVTDAHASGDPRRVHSGEKAINVFTYCRKHFAGLLQQVTTQPGTRLRLAAYAHAWSNHKDLNLFWCWNCNPRNRVEIPTGKDHALCSFCGTGINRDCDLVFPHPDDGRWSEGAKYGWFYSEETDNANLSNFTFSVGIDPAGGADPLADTVVWGKGAHVYNKYSKLPPVEAIARAETVTVFLRSKTRFAFTHSDAYWDDVNLVVIEGDEPEKPPDPEPVEWNYPVIEKGSKLGVHSIFSNKVRDFAQALVNGGTHFPVVKAVDDFGWLVEVKKISPKTITIGRLTSPPDTCGGVEKASFSLEKYANKHIGAILKKIEGDPRLKDAVDYWEVYNEPDPPSADGHRRLAELMIVTMGIAEQHDIKIAIFTFNAGCPEWDEMEAVVETGVFGVARKGGHILTTHEGVFGTDPVDKWFGSSIPGSPRVAGAGALNFRYRYLYHLIEKRNEVVPLVLSEWYGGSYEKDGTAADVVEQLRWWDSEAKKDYYLWAVCPFTLGPSRQWKRQDYEFAYPALVDYMLSVQNQQNATVEKSPVVEPPIVEPPVVEPPVVKPDRGAPREQYSRTYVLLPPDADSAWAKAVVEATWDTRRFTIGSGADDAGLGDLDVRNVIAINPSGWPTDLKAFFDTYYPGNPGETGVNVTSIEAASPVELLAKLSEAL